MTRAKKEKYTPEVGERVMWGKPGEDKDGVVERVYELEGVRNGVALVRKYLYDTGLHDTLKSGRPSPQLTTVSVGSLRPYKKNAWR